MARPLDELLQPGEQVLWREPKPRLFEAWPRILGGGFLFTGLLIAIVDRFDPEVWVKVFGVVVAFSVVLELIVWFLPWLNFRVETLLTTSRLLQRHSHASDDLVDVLLAEVTEITLSSTHSLTLTTRDGGTNFVFSHYQSQALAAELTRATGLPPPRLIGRLAGLRTYGHELGTDVCFMLGAVLLADWFALVRGSDLDLGDLLPLGSSIMSLWVVAMLVGLHLTTVLGLVMLRPWVSADEARAWLDLATEGEKSEGAWSRLGAHLLHWRSPLYAWLVRLLWGAPVNGPNAEAPGHG